MKRYNALLDTETHILLSLGIPSVIAFLTEAIPGTFAAISVNWPHYESDFFALSLKVAEYPEWQWSSSERKFRKAAPDIFAEDNRGRALLASEKGRAFHTIARYIDLSREAVEVGTTHQDIVYFEKKSEAQKLKNGGYIMKDPLEYPFVSGYASSAGISIQEAVDCILHKAGKSSEILAKTENLRVRYFDRLKKASLREEVYVILADFHRESYYAGFVS